MITDELIEEWRSILINVFQHQSETVNGICDLARIGLAVTPQMKEAFANIIASARPFMSDEPQLLAMKLAKEALCSLTSNPPTPQESE